MTLHRRRVVGMASAMALCIMAPSSATGQQVNDSAFRFENPDPAFPLGNGPRVCVDETHHNVHSLGRLFAPFVSVLRSDGFRPQRFTQAISRETLEACAILILGSGRAGPQADDLWAYPHASAYSRAEMNAVVRWVRSGGALLLFWDHAPAAGAAAGLAALLGVQLLDAWADQTPQGNYPEIVRRADGLMADHLILRGRRPSERIDSIATHGAGAFFPSAWIQPVLLFGPRGTGWVFLGDMGQALPEIPEQEWPRFSIEGWLLAGTRQWGAGRIVFFGDVTLCTAQLYGPAAIPLAMSHPSGAQNPLLCLNMVRWLAGAL